MSGIAATLTSWNAGLTRATAPPRSTLTKLRAGRTLGAPHDAAQQRRILSATLDLLAQDAPLDPIYLQEGENDA